MRDKDSMTFAFMQDNFLVILYFVPIKITMQRDGTVAERLDTCKFVFKFLSWKKGQRNMPTRKSSCVNARGLPLTPHNHPDPVRWLEGKGRVGGVPLSYLGEREGEVPCLGWCRGDLEGGERREGYLSYPGVLPTSSSPLWTDRHMWKHYLPPSFGCGR